MKSERAPLPPGNDLKRLQRIDFNLTNLCNLKCRMCGSDSSSAWVEDDIYLRTNTDVGSFRPKEIEKLERAFATDEALIKYLDSLDLSALKSVSFLGGEPFLQPQMYLILNYLIERDIVDLRIRITSNASVMNEKIRLLASFREVTFSLSIEGVGPIYRYIRGGDKASSDEVAANIAHLKSLGFFKFSINCAIGAYSVFGLADLFMWLKTHLPELPPGFILHHWDPIFEPSYLSLRVLPIEVRRRALEGNLQKLKEEGFWDPDIVDGDLTNLMRLDLEHDPIKLNQFISFTRALDRRRGESIVAVVPEFAEMFESSNLLPATY